MVRIQDGYTETLRHDATFTLYAAWSPDNDRIAYRTGMDDDPLISIGQAIPNREGGIMETQILLNSEDFIDYLVWSPDGQQIAFISHTRSTIQTYKLHLLTVGEQQAQLLFSSSRPFLDVLWTGESISFLNTDGQTVALHTVSPDTLVVMPFPILALPGQYGRLAWSGRQQSLVFVNYNQGQNTVYRLNLDGSDRKTLYRSSIPIQRVTWSSDGEWIFLGTGYREQTQLYQMRPDGSDLTYLTDVAFDWDIPLSPTIDKTWQSGLPIGFAILMGSLAILRYRFR